MTVLYAAAAILVVELFQSMLTGLWPPAATYFDLPLILVVYYAIAKGPGVGLMMGTGAGLLQDSLEGTLLGASALSKALVGYLVGILGLRFALVPLIARIIVLAAATVLSRSIEVGTLAIMGKHLSYAPYPHLLGAVPGNCLVGAVVLAALRKEVPE